jgi:hypothetical protein
VFEQALTALEEMTSWTEGAFSFHPAESGDAPPVSFSLQQTVLEAVAPARRTRSRGGSFPELTAKPWRRPGVR